MCKHYNILNINTKFLIIFYLLVSTSLSFEILPHIYINNNYIIYTLQRFSALTLFYEKKTELYKIFFSYIFVNSLLFILICCRLEFIMNKYYYSSAVVSK